jgi:hypothetical protein
MAIIPNDEKVFMVSNTTNTTYSGSQALKDMNEWYTMEDVKNTVLPYKVYTALLTQSGGDAQYDLIDEPLTIGVTYKISDQAGGTWDFTNVGAPNNDIDTYFVATGTTPNSWGNGRLIYTKGAPIVTVLENTIGNVWFTYDGVGNYAINSNGAFIENKYVQPPISVSGFDPFLGDGGSVSLPSFTATARCIYWRNDSGSVSIFTTKAGAYENSILYNTPIEIRVYN